MQQTTPTDNERNFQIEDGILVFLLILSLLGIAVTDYSVGDGYGYWLMMVFVFAGFALLISWLKAKRDEIEFGDIAIDQLKHWGTSLVAVLGALMLQKSGQLAEMAAILVMLLILSLATMLDGLRIGRDFALLGLFLNIAALVIAYTGMENYTWILIGVAIAIIAGTLFWDWLIRKIKEVL